jgi:transposase
MKAYSTDLREKFVLAYEAGEGTLDEVADTFGVGRCTVARMMKLWRAGQSLVPLPHGGGYPKTLDERVARLVAKASGSATRCHARGVGRLFEKKSQSASASLKYLSCASETRPAA